MEDLINHKSKIIACVNALNESLKEGKEIGITVNLRIDDLVYQEMTSKEAMDEYMQKGSIVQKTFVGIKAKVYKEI